MKKHLLFMVSVLALVSCTGNLDPWSKPDSGQGSTQTLTNNTGTLPEINDPEQSGVTVDEESSEDNDVEKAEFDGIITITFGASGAEISGSVKDVSVTDYGDSVVAFNSGKKVVKYILKGSSDNCSFKIRGEKKQAIVLDGLTLKSTTGAAINNQNKKRTFVVVKNTNILEDCEVDASGNYPAEKETEDMKAAFFSEAQLIFSGDGSLTVNALGKAGITSDDYIRFLTGPNITVNSAKGHGVRGKDAIIVSGGTVNVTLKTTATGKKCFSTDSLACFVGGSTTLTNMAEAGNVDGELTGAAGIKADKLFVMQGGALKVISSGEGCKCISGDGKGFFEGGTVICESTGQNHGSSTSGWHGDSDESVSAKAIKFDDNLIFSGADVTANCTNHESIESKGTIYISEGKISATSSSDDAINSGSTMTITGGSTYAYSSGNDGIDSNGNLIIKGGNVFAIGCGSPEVALDANTEKNYRLYILGGNVIAINGIESGSCLTQAGISTTCKGNTNYCLCDGDAVIYSFKTPSLSNGSSISNDFSLHMTSPSLTGGNTYSLKTSASVTGAESCIDGVLSTGGTASGGSSASVTAASAFTGSGTGGMGGGGNQPNIPGRR